MIRWHSCGKKLVGNGLAGSTWGPPGVHLKMWWTARYTAHTPRPPSSQHSYRALSMRTERRTRDMSTQLQRPYLVRVRLHGDNNNKAQGEQKRRENERRVRDQKGTGGAERREEKRRGNERGWDVCTYPFVALCCILCSCESHASDANTRHSSVRTCGESKLRYTISSRLFHFTFPHSRYRAAFLPISLPDRLFACSCSRLLVA